MCKLITAIIGIVVSLGVGASEVVTTEPDPNSYNFVSSYAISIDAAPAKVWPHLVDVGRWMYEFEMAHVSGSPGEVGQVIRLYRGQDFLMQFIEAIPDKLLVMANLPSTFRGEKSTGIGIVQLQADGQRTYVTTTMSRRYTWTGEGESPQKIRRQTQEFQEETEARWNRFLTRLKENAEGGLEEAN